MRVRYSKNLVNELENSELLISEFPFNIDNYIIEIGMGKGEMITKMAQAFPDKLFLGIEKNPTIAAKAARKAKDLSLKNFKVMLLDAEEIDEKLTGKTSKIWLTFSDPWPKKKHAKRRLTSSVFLEKYKKILKKLGEINFKTDNKGLFEYSVEQFNEQKWLILGQSNDLHKSIFNKDNFQTGYEEKFSKRGMPIYFLKARQQ